MGGDDDTATVIEEARAELEEASRELERLTEQLNDCTELVERLEVLADALLAILSTPAVVVDAEGTLVGVSGGAAEQFPELADAIGRSASGVLAGRIGLAESDADTVALPDGSRLLVLAP